MWVLLIIWEPPNVWQPDWVEPGSAGGERIHPRTKEIEIYWIHCKAPVSRTAKERLSAIRQWWGTSYRAEWGVMGTYWIFPFSVNCAWLYVVHWLVTACGCFKVGCLMSLFASAWWSLWALSSCSSSIAQGCCLKAASTFIFTFILIFIYYVFIHLFRSYINQSHRITNPLLFGKHGEKTMG